MITSQMTASSASAPTICARVRRIFTSEQKRGQFRIARAHERPLAAREDGHVTLARELVHRAQRAAVVRHVALMISDPVALQPRTRMRAQRSTGHDVKSHGHIGQRTCRPSDGQHVGLRLR